MVNEISSTDLENKITSDEQPMVLDIRSEAEVAHGVLPNSEHLPMHLLPLRMNEFPQDKEIILYCRSGARSYHACMYLMQQGFKNVVNLRGGIIDWARNGYEIVSYA
ncbi:MAG: rhodanese-like domain-containing protein [Gammaproteobacteria bacterium]|nr:rhodanese-like domain-containing protein [Gammaproteobacteria bacterium]